MQVLENLRVLYYIIYKLEAIDIYSNTQAAQMLI